MVGTDGGAQRGGDGIWWWCNTKVVSGDDSCVTVAGKSWSRKWLDEKKGEGGGGRG